MTQQEQREILDILSDRIWVITNHILTNYPHYNISKTIKSSRRMTKDELQRFIRRLTKWFPQCNVYYHISDYRKLDTIAFRMKITP